MRICDVTLSYTETSGGIRTYIDAKRDYLLAHTDHEHVLVVPGEDDAVERNGRATTYRIASPPLPGCEPYRFFWRPRPIYDALVESQPDIVELASFYVAPSAAMRFRRTQRQQGHTAVVAGYFHTDIADAYIGQPIRNAFHDWPDAIEWLGDHVADLLETGAEHFFGRTFSQCDLAMAASPDQAARLHDYGVEHVEIVPLGVDLQLFSPTRRSQSTRDSLGVARDELLLIYAGRLDVEKHVEFLAEAIELVDASLKPRLVMLGEGPLRERLEELALASNRLDVLPYESDKNRFAKLLAAGDIYVTAGPHETFGLSVIEAQAAGLPVVGVAAGALTERVDEQTGRLGPVDDAQAFARNIEQVAGRRDSMAREARCRIEQHYGWRSTFEKLCSLYQNSLASVATAAESPPEKVNRA
jgi:alpha-1,6-mannosyltransferase